MKIIYTDHFRKQLVKWYKKKPELRKIVPQVIIKFETNSRHPGLDTHKLKGKRLDQYAFWIEGDLRIVFIKIGEEIIFTEVITHDKY